MKATLLCTALISIFISLKAQTPIDIYESTLKIKGLSEESYMCGLAAGDQLIFNFEEVNGKELKEVEIIEYPSTSKYMDYKSSRINNKTLNISKTGIYKFRFSNSSISGRVCNFKLQRIPISEQTKNFNTSVYYETHIDTNIINLNDVVAKVHSQANENGNTTRLNFTLPKNTVAWSYYIGVDQAGQQSFDNAVKELSKSATPLINSIVGYSPLVALALGSTSFLTQIQSGEDIDYVIVDNINANLYESNQAYRYYKSGKVINDFSRMTEPLHGTYFICLRNDNLVTGVNVVVKVTAVTLQTKEEPYLKE